MTKIERASQQVNIAIEAVAHAAREVGEVATCNPGEPWRVPGPEMREMRAALKAWTDATNGFLRLVGRPEANEPEGEGGKEGDAPVPA
jgi:hypothetical protein